jgi:molecular chaperone GrpE
VIHRVVFQAEGSILRAMHDDSNSTEARGAEAAVDAAVESLPEPSAPPAAEDPLSAAVNEASRFKDQWLRTAADFDNFRKRTRKEMEDARRTGREDLLRALLPVFDNLERAFQSAQRSTDVKAVADGLSLVQRQFTESLGREGISRVPTVGHAFDPAVHEAIQQVETADHAPGTVLAEVQPGYVQGERLVRAAMVVVAKAKGEGDAEGRGQAAS